MDPKTILTPILTKESKQNALFDTEGVETVDPYPKQHNTNVPGYDNFSKNNYYPSSMLLPVDTKYLSLASLSLNSDIALDESTKSNCSLLPLHSNIADLASSNTYVIPLFDIADPVRKEIGFKLEKDLFVECDTIDGMVIRSFTTIDDLEQFVARSAPENAMKLSPRLKKIRKIDPSSPGDIERDKLDASLLVLSEEPYYDDYNIHSNTRRLVVDCQNLFCVLGCICDSLNSSRPLPEHCRHTECMFNRTCCYKQKLAFCDSPSSIERYDDKFSKHALLKELSSIKKEIYLQTDIIDRLTAELREKQFEIDNLTNQKMRKRKATSENNLTLLPLAIKSETKVKNVKAREEKFRSEIKEETEGSRVKAKVEVEGAKMKTRRSLALDGLKLGSFPFDESILNRLAAENTTFSVFVRQLLRKMFTSDFLSSKTLSSMKDEHLAAITDATMKRFTFYRQRNGECVRVTPELVKQIIRSEFNVKQTQKKNKEKAY